LLSRSFRLRFYLCYISISQAATAFALQNGSVALGADARRSILCVVKLVHDPRKTIQKAVALRWSDNGSEPLLVQIGWLHPACQLAFPGRRNLDTGRAFVVCGGLSPNERPFVEVAQQNGDVRLTARSLLN
jgi:hypothetical protein